MCGVIGLWGNGPIIRDLYQGLLAIQHRGQDSAGIITFDGRFHTKKGNGLVHDIFTPEAVENLRGPIGIGHTRYPTIGGGGDEDAQPFQINSPFGIIMAHNGNVANYRELRDELYEDQHRLLNSDCDLEIILNLFAESLAGEQTKTLAPEHIFRAVEAVYPEGPRQLLRRRLHRRPGPGGFPRSLRHQAPGLRRSAATASCPPTPSPRKRSASTS